MMRVNEMLAACLYWDWQMKRNCDGEECKSGDGCDDLLGKSVLWWRGGRRIKKTKSEGRRRKEGTVSEMNRGGINAPKRRNGLGERCRARKRRVHRHHGAIRCTPSICSVHCFINSIKLQASWGRTLLLQPSIWISLSIPTPPLIWREIYRFVPPVLHPVPPQQNTLTSVVRGNITKEIKKYRRCPYIIYTTPLGDIVCHDLKEKTIQMCSFIWFLNA